MNISTLSQQLNISVSELRRKLAEAGFKVSPRARKIDNVLARQILEKLADSKTKALAEQEKEQAAIRAKKVKIGPVIVVRDLASLLGLPVAAVIKTLIQNGVMASLNEQIDFDTAAVVAQELGFEAEEEKIETEGYGTVSQITAAEPKERLVNRPPIVAVMGHVDHGKTRLLDTIRKTNVIETEAGAITQHIGAYRVIYNKKTIVFLDTPGHEAFAAMRARGANVTDIIILVVAADDGVKQQTLEVIKRARLTKTPLIVAINKIDKEGANQDLVKKQLAEEGVVSEEWGGKTIFVPISAKQNIGVDKLLDMILLTAEVEDYKANPNGVCVGTVIESHLSKTRGVIATILVQNGSLKVGDIIVVGSSYGKVRNLEDENLRSIRLASPSIPVRITGLSDVPEVGDLMRVCSDLRTAQFEAKKTLQARKAKRLAYKSGLLAADTENRQLNLILKADVQGSLEAILQELSKLENQDVKVKIVSQGVGDINESDVLAAESAKATIVGFSNKVLPAAAKLAKQKNVSIDTYEIIYELTEDITKAILKLVLPEVEEVVLGKAKILATFITAKDHTIAGGSVLEGKLSVGQKAFIVKGDKRFGPQKILELQKNKIDVKQIEAGSDFGIKLAGTIKLEKGDLLLITDERLKEKKLKKV